MALEEIYEFGPTSVTATAYASVTGNAHFAIPVDAVNYAAKLKCGSVLGNLRVDWTLDHAHENPDETTPTWENLLTGKCISYTNQIEVEFEPTSVRPLLPYGRLQYITKSLDASGATVKDLVGYILSEFK